MRTLNFLDLHAQYQTIKPEIDGAIEDVIKNSLFVRGPYVEKFESDFANLLDARHCISCGNGTDALYIAMKALGVKDGDEVICPAHSWISTSQTITQAGAKVVFCDTSRDTYTIDTEIMKSLVNERTVGIIPVHLFGQAADMDPILACAKENDLWVIEDCAQAHLAEYKGRKVGTMGALGTFSFYPGKNLGAMGDAGAILTDDEELANYCKRFARHGGLIKGEHLIEGINSRMDGLQAAVLGVKIRHIEAWTQQRRFVADRYLARINNPLIQLPIIAPGNNHVWHLFVIRCSTRNDLRAYLQERGIPTVVNYPVALPFLPAYQALQARPSDFPVSFQHQSEILSIPLCPEMDTADIDYVISQLNKYKV